MLDLTIGLSALQAAQQGLAIAGNNLANASTPGYHRQIASLADNTPTQIGTLNFGSGVSVADIQRAVSNQLDASLASQTSQSSFVDTSLLSSTQVEQAISTGTSSPGTQLDNLLNTLQALSSSPGNGATQQAVVSSAASVANALNTASSDLRKIRNGLDGSIGGAVNQINSLTTRIASLNLQIASQVNQGASPNDLLDQQGQLVNKLSELASVQVQNTSNGQVSVVVSGVLLVADGQSRSLVTGADSSGNTTVSSAETGTALTNAGGQLGALISQRDTLLPDFQNRIDALARQIASSFDKLQSTGLGGSGGFTQLNGQRGTSTATATLNAAGLGFPPQVGSLFVGVTNTATGQRTVTEVPIDPQTQSLTDVANAISGTVSNVQAFVNGQSKTLSITASPGYTFDFTGGVNSSPATTFAGGSTTTPTAGGVYTGSGNDNYTFTFPSSGTIGVTPNLKAQVTDKSGAVIGTVNVGQGYIAGQPIKVANGITLSLAAGNAVAGDSFTTPVVGNPDSAGLLSALGLNTFFSGSDAGSLSVNKDLIADPGRIATSRTGQPGDTSNLQRLVALGTATVLGNGKQTFGQFSNQLVSDIGSNVQSLTDQQNTNTLLTSNIKTQQQSLSGVNTDEELANVLKFQHMYELAGKYISTVNAAIQQLINSI